ncbi:uncharacterized protein LOC126678368 [Mercurialis annua]|uniref:uncharacterized protein LOC126678368 n=1 Tax=Mercurialis annua TaxID=3986 RepID=UPI00215F599D|nr:uncharacterized protein LOC126678368 [Mercurialis annua]
MATNEVDSWMTPIIKYLDQGELPPDRIEVLNRTSLTHPWARCVSTEIGNLILMEIHEGICEAHEGAVTIARKTMLQVYYWPTIKEDAKALVKNCDKCQRHDNSATDQQYPKDL